MPSARGCRLRRGSNFELPQQWITITATDFTSPLRAEETRPPMELPPAKNVLGLLVASFLWDETLAGVLWPPDAQETDRKTRTSRTKPFLRRARIRRFRIRSVPGSN